MKLHALLAALLLPLTLIAADKPDKDGFISLFDGKTLNGWKLGGAEGSFKVGDGAIVANGKPIGHLFYDGEVNNHDFKNFELKVDVKTTEGSNGGVYFHTKFQDKGWPDMGFECQVNATHKDTKKGGGLYSVVDIKEAPVGDGQWWTYHIIVKDNKITLKVNDKVTVEWTQPEGYAHPQFKNRKLGSGTFAFQAHDEKSVVYFKNVKVKPLP
ncbi:MAG: 3-keto-disaccharide hydrolase [Verrucomicrobiota bacterium]